MRWRRVMWGLFLFLAVAAGALARAQEGWTVYRCRDGLTVATRPVGNVGLDLQWRGEPARLYLTRSSPESEFRSAALTWTLRAGGALLQERGRPVALGCATEPPPAPPVPAGEGLLGRGGDVARTPFCRTYRCGLQSAVQLDFFEERQYRLEGVRPEAYLVVLLDRPGGRARSVALRTFGQALKPSRAHADLVRAATGVRVDDRFLGQLVTTGRQVLRASARTYVVTWPTLDIGGAVDARLTVTLAP